MGCRGYSSQRANPKPVASLRLRDSVQMGDPRPNGEARQDTPSPPGETHLAVPGLFLLPGRIPLSRARGPGHRGSGSLGALIFDSERCQLTKWQRLNGHYQRGSPMDALAQRPARICIDPSRVSAECGNPDDDALCGTLLGDNDAVLAENAARVCPPRYQLYLRARIQYPVERQSRPLYAR